MFLREVCEIADKVDDYAIERLAKALRALRERDGRLFIAGLGGSAANASHAANDFRKLVGLEAYALNDNVAELTARANDEGWDTIYTGAMQTSKARKGDALLVLSVGGGMPEVSRPIVTAIDYAIEKNMDVFGIVGNSGGHTLARASIAVLIPVVDETRITPHTEAFQSVVLHCLACHPLLQERPTKW
jgi:D-sedoheptulose 7-phosphate isomerase